MPLRNSRRSSGQSLNCQQRVLSFSLPTLVTRIDLLTRHRSSLYMPPDWLASPFRKAVIPAAGRESHEDAREALLDSNLASDEDDKGYPPEETSNPQKLRTRRQAPPVTVARATARLVGGVLLFILVGFTLSQVDWSRTPAIVGEGCTSNFLAMDRADPSFWSIEIDPAVRRE